jgi:co-chaperonin GroES (HSP10)
MHRAINTLKAVLVFSCLVIAACSGSSSADSQASSSAIDSSIKAATAAVAANAASVGGTRIPSAASIIDSSGNTWTVSGGVIHENGGPAGYSAAVTKLLYDNSTIYQENSAGSWWSWNGSTWVATSDPSKVPSVSGSNIPTEKQITDTSGNIWAVSGGKVYENGVLAAYTNIVKELLYENNTFYHENTEGNWYTWSGGKWVASSNPAKVSASGANIPATAEITDSSGNIWAVSGGGVYKNGALAGNSSNVKELLYENNTIYAEVTSGGWYTWTSSKWVASSNPTASSAGTTGTATLSWSVPTANTNGTSLTDLAGYIIHYGTSSGALTQTIQLTDPDLTSYVVRNLAAGTYYFAISGYATTGMQGTDSPEVSKTIP